MIKIVIVEDHTLFREGVKSLLELLKDFEVVAEFANGKEFIDKLHVLDADVVLLDIEMPIMNGLEAAYICSIQKPQFKIIALSMHSDHHYYCEMIRNGVSGFVIKDATSIELEKAIRDVHLGMGFFSPDLLQKAIIKIPEVEQRKKQLEKLQLTEREQEVLDEICKGMSTAQICETLFLSPKTVESHKSRLFVKTNTKNTANLIIFAVKNGLIEI